MPVKFIKPLGKANASKLISTPNDMRYETNSVSLEPSQLLATFNSLLTNILSKKQNASSHISYVTDSINNPAFDLETRGLLSKLLAFMSGPAMSSSQITYAINVFYWTSNTPIWKLNDASVKNFLVGFVSI
jgi:hypothetical protein